MTRILAALALLSALPAAASPAAAPGAATRKTAAPVVHGKPQAPVAVTATLGDGRAIVTVRFDAPATDAAVEVHGVDGLVVTSAAVPLSGGRFARGESVRLEVTFTEGDAPGLLAVSVSGSFGGAHRIATASFAARSPAPEQLKRAGSASPDSTGRRIKVMPAEAR